ncbi:MULTISPECIES: anti-sigma factor domain-containing protein [unclassified Bacillus (in: firmicutes)]|uniref:anti-sigma factor domain-containing protein n=1 Tax=unclassified Bacillus (in: firmicutes) TaxID=185979 RepID=UPI0008E8D15B|nr:MULTISPECIES: anti-sigma factor domain-containing protein [unclassified Bacillus (in: firmicutes)]SFJ06115.1 Anti-sigma factor N-terminus [Bacillus sp. 71mf]SFS68006.1 Anti-sigma factor N-terminus [Bacillus sp. 103mf]
MNKGIVMDIRKRSIVVLTPDGEFINCKKKSNSYIIGQEIVFHEQEKRQVTFSVPSILKPALLIFACFLCVFLFVFNQPEEKALAYVSIDINPSLEVSVTKDLRVTELRACNEDGRRILKEIKGWKNEPLQDVVRAIVKQSKEDGYLTSEKQVMLTSVAKEKSLEPQLQKAMQELKREYDTQHVTVIYQESTMQIRENAQKAGVSTGIYLKQENEKKKSSVSPAPSQVQKEQPSEVHSQPDASPNSDSPSNSSSSVQQERSEPKEQQEKEQQQPARVQQPQPERNSGHREENNDKEQKKEDKEQKNENKEQRKEQKKEYQEQKKEQKEQQKENKNDNSSKHDEKEKGKHDK